MENYERVWSKCFNELFKPSERLNRQILETGLIEGSYISVHFRFVNALEKFEDGYYNELESQEQEILINRCLKLLAEIKEKETMPIIVFSDSNRFREVAYKNGYSVLKGKVEHISFANNDDTIMKTFVDFYVIGRSKKVYSARDKGKLYGSVFSYYAALAGGAEFQRINV